MVLSRDTGLTNKLYISSEIRNKLLYGSLKVLKPKTKFPCHPKLLGPMGSARTHCPETDDLSSDPEIMISFT